MPILFVVTEHPSFLDASKEAHFERIRGRLEQAAGAEVRSVRYSEVETLEGADAVVLSGSFAPWATHDAHALERLGDTVRGYSGPVLGICAGMQLQAMFASGSVRRAFGRPAEGFRHVRVLDGAGLFEGLGERMTVYAHHSHEVVECPAGFRALAASQVCAVEAMVNEDRQWWGTQFHPEEFSETHPAGERVLQNFFVLAGVHPRAFSGG